MIRFAAAGCALMLLAACSSGGAHSSPPPTPTSTHVLSTAAADPNAQVCTDLRAPLVDQIVATFQGWNPDTDEFDPKVGAELRDEATQMYGFAAKATGATADAIVAEAKGLTDISVAMDEQDDSALATAASAANGALAALRGTCNF